MSEIARTHHAIGSVHDGTGQISVTDEVQHVLEAE